MGEDFAIRIIVIYGSGVCLWGRRDVSTNAHKIEQCSEEDMAITWAVTYP